MNIANFIEWFITQFINIASTMLGKLDQIVLYGNITLMDFIITITIVGAFINILITTPELLNNASKREESRARANEVAKAKINYYKKKN